MAAARSFYIETNTTNDWVIHVFKDQYTPFENFVSHGIILSNDSGNDILLAFPPADDTPTGSILLGGTAKSGEKLSFDIRHVHRVAVKSGAGGDAYRLWAW